jgi:outer membrane protein insertion porin family
LHLVPSRGWRGREFGGRVLACLLLAGSVSGLRAQTQTSAPGQETGAAASAVPGPAQDTTLPGQSGAPSTTTTVSGPLSGAAADKEVKAPVTSPLNDSSKVNPAESKPKIVGDAVKAPKTIVSGDDASNMWKWKGLTVERIQFEGVTFSGQDTLPTQLAQKQGKPLDPDAVRQSMRRLYATGRYRNLEARGVRTETGVALIFSGVSRYYVGRVAVTGVNNDRLTSLLEASTNLQPGMPFAQADLDTALKSVKDTLGQNGYYESNVTAVTKADDDGQQMNVTIAVQQGVKARVGAVAAAGDTGMTQADFRKKAKLKFHSKVRRETSGNALTNLRNQYQKKDRLEAKVTLDKKSYEPPTHRLDYNFTANQGPLVTIETEGLKVSKGRKKLLIPIYQESAVDNDLLNEGSHNIREYLERQGYFDATVSVNTTEHDAQHESIVYHIDKGQKYKVIAVNISGVKYFPEDLLRERMQVVKADHYLRHGRYSPALLTSDVNAIENLYRANGFNDVNVTTDVSGAQTDAKGHASKTGSIRVSITIVEGLQQKFGTATLSGVDPARASDVRALMNTSPGQPYSLATLAGDRDAILSYYLSHGFDAVNIIVQQNKNATDPTKTDVALNVVEGPQVFVDRILLSGVHYTRPQNVQSQLRVHAGDPLDQTALLDTQRNLYNLALFNEVNVAVQNPTGDAARKNVLVQLTEAKRWDVTYGGGFEAETGTPVTNCTAQASQGFTTCTPEGKTGISPRVSLDVTRINFRGRDQTFTLHTTYGLLEKVATLTFSNPHVFGRPKLDMSVSGGYSDVQDISTFAAATLQGTIKLTQHVTKADTFVYDYTYRRVTIDQSSLQVAANLIPLLAQPDRTAGPGVTWIHDTRQPSPLDATHGSYTSVQEFIAHTSFGAETDFNRVDASNSTYYALDKKKNFILARNTRFGFENSFGAFDETATNAQCQGGVNGPINYPSCVQIPLPERLYAGGATSHRGFPINGAGPRDLLTGYPVGGTAAFVNTIELRFPGPILPVIGDNLGLVLFHDMGNVFTNVSDIWPSFKRIHQPNAQTCQNVTPTTNGTTGLTNVGVCDFNYFSHAVGLGLRYKTPVGPIRVDFSYNLNPPVYPIIEDFNDSLGPHVGQEGHFNFFFSIGQSF